MIATIAILAGMLLPLLPKAKTKAQGIGCMNNTRRLMLTWKQYSLDNNKNVVNNFNIDTTQATITLGKKDPATGYRNWVNNVMSWAASEDITNKFYLSQGPFTRYVGSATSAYLCPADRFLSARQKSAKFPAWLRSLAINACFGPYSDPPQANHPELGGYNRYVGFRHFLEESAVKRPADIMVISTSILIPPTTAIT